MELVGVVNTQIAFNFCSLWSQRLTEGSLLSNLRHSRNPENERPNPGILIQCFLCKCFWSDIHRCAACVTEETR